MVEHTGIYTSDLHGNEIQFQKLVQYALEIEAGSVIIGGDICPKPGSLNIEGEVKGMLDLDDYLEDQRIFLKDKLPEIVSPLKQRNIALYLMMGNDDCAANLDVLERQEGRLYYVIHNRRLPLTEKHEIAGYGRVPITPFGIKDWETYEFSNAPGHWVEEYEKRKSDRDEFNLNGLVSTEKGWRKFEFTGEVEKEDSVQLDLEKEVFQENPGKAVYVMHAPPYDTNLDMISPGFGPDTGERKHVGSMAIRQFIMEKQPYLCLHGHIHETVELSGEFRDMVGSTLCMSPGNGNYTTALAVLVFDVYNIAGAKRLEL